MEVTLQSFSNNDVLNKYKELYIIYDSVMETDNKNLLLVLYGSKIALITSDGKQVIASIDTRFGERLFITKTFIQIWDKSPTIIKIYRLEKSPDGLYEKQLISTQVNKTKSKVNWEIQVGKTKMNSDRPLVLSREFKSALMLSYLGDNTCIVCTKNGVIHTGEVYLNVLESVSNNELLGVRHLYVENTSLSGSPIRSIDIMNHLGIIKRRVTSWSKEDEQRYGVTLAILYSRGYNLPLKGSKLKWRI